MSYQFSYHFTLEEANMLVPSLREIFKQIRELASPSIPEGPPLHTNGNGTGHGIKDFRPVLPITATQEERQEAILQLLEGVRARGIVIQDPLRGLIDFPSIRNGKEVFLCYELNDGKQIQFYHELDAGYAGRTPLKDDEE